MTQQEHKTVFISYRRSLSSDAARAVFLDLRYHDYDAFLDVDSINSGHFDSIILRQIEARAHFVLILKPGTLERCAESGDWLRREIEHAMDMQRNIVLLMYDGFSFTGTEKYLTGKLAELSRFNGMTVPHDYFDAAMEKLRTRFLTEPLYGVITPTPARDRSEIQSKIARLIAETPATFSQSMRIVNKQYAEAYVERGQKRLSKGDIDAAIADFNEAIRLDPENVDAFCGRGLAFQSKDDFDKALYDFEEMIQLSSEEPDLYKIRGVALEGKSDFKGAIADYQKYLDLGGGQSDGDRAGVEQRIHELQAKLQ